ncbi:MAG: hypothetical protein CMJ67_00290 [Planctomycetaceae bacterium]|nr:hypothetical protein [Planctomycetaceae bacterium]
MGAVGSGAWDEAARSMAIHFLPTHPPWISPGGLLVEIMAIELGIGLDEEGCSEDASVSEQKPNGFRRYFR